MSAIQALSVPQSSDVRSVRAEHRAAIDQLAVVDDGIAIFQVQRLGTGRAEAG